MVFDDIFDSKLQAGIGLNKSPFHKPKKLRANHLVDEILSIDSYRGITTQRLPAQVHMVHHLKWIAKYANACKRYHVVNHSSV